MKQDDSDIWQLDAPFLQNNRLATYATANIEINSDTS